jgi:acetoin utilization protein AcuB
MLVSEWMTPDPRTVSPDTPVMEAMQYLREGGYRRLPVVRDGVLVGIVTDRDLKEATPSRATTLSIYELNYLLSKLKVKDVMRTPVITVRSADTIEQAALLMEEHRVSGLPVLDGSKLVGILTITDLMRALVTFLALREGGKRVTVDLPDEPGVLAKAAQAGPPSNIVAAVTTGVQPGHKRRLVLRVTGEGADGYADRLRQAGVEVIDER